MTDTKRALVYATLKHHGQIRKGSGLPYIIHPMAVADNVRAQDAEEYIVVAAYLHDVLEDTTVSYQELEIEFGEKVAELVEILTRKEDEQYFDYIDRVAAYPVAVQIKLADLEHNMSDLDPDSSLKQRYLKAYSILKGE